jgi:hypothetical protein
MHLLAALTAITKSEARTLNHYLMVQMASPAQIIFQAATPFSLEATSCGCQLDGARRALCPLNEVGERRPLFLERAQSQSMPEREFSRDPQEASPSPVHRDADVAFLDAGI